MTEQTLKDIDKAFKALEERDELLDKIRAEIKENIETFSMSDWETNNILADGLQMALNIIDGYREGEQK